MRKETRSNESREILLPLHSVVSAGYDGKMRASKLLFGEKMIIGLTVVMLFWTGCFFISILRACAESDDENGADFFFGAASFLAMIMIWSLLAIYYPDGPKEQKPAEATSK